MHSKSRSTARQTFAAVLLSCALIGVLASPVSADSESDLKHKRAAVKGDIGNAQKSYDQSSKKYQQAANAYKMAQTKLDAAEARLGKTRGQVAAAEAKDAQMQAKLEKSEAALKKALAQLAAGEKSLAESEARVKRFTIESLQEGDRGLRAFGDLLRGASPTSFSQQMSLNHSVSDAQLATMERLDATRVMLELNRDRVQKLRDEVAAQRKKAAENLVQKKVLEAAAEKQKAKVDDLVKVRAAAKSKADKILADDAARLHALEAERDRLSSRLRALAAKEAAKARARAQAQANQGGGGGGGSSHGTRGGYLSYPVHGPITSPYGMRVHPITGVYKLHDGTDFGVGCGTPIHAAAGGTVIGRYYNAGYGNRLIINHGMVRGVNLVTAYNHATHYIVGVGQHVSRGQTVGYVGSTGYSTGCHMHFMVLVNGATTNPMNWL